MNWAEYLPKELAEQHKFGSLGFIAKSSFLLEKNAFLLADVPTEIGLNKFGSSFPLLPAISGNAKAAVRLAKLNFGNEVYVILRTLIERIITFFYLESCDQEERKNYQDYSNQKTYRKIEKVLSIFKVAYPEDFGNKNIEDIIDLEKVPELKAVVSKFSGKKSKNPITRWSKLSLEKKIKKIEGNKRINTKFLTILLDIIYDDASEALHGTLYGCTFHLGIFNLGVKIKEKKDIVSHHHANLCMLFLVTSLALGEILKYVYLKCDLEEIGKLAKETKGEIMELCKKAKLDPNVKFELNKIF